jgi:integrase
MANVGRKKSLTVEDWYNAVIKYSTLDDNELAKELGIGRDEELRVKYYVPALEHIDKMSNLELDVSLRNFDNFRKLKIIQQFERTLINRPKPLKLEVRMARLRAVYNMCIYLNQHPRKLNLEDVADRVTESRLIFEAGEKAPKGLSYSSQRKGMRSFFINVHGIAGQVLTTLGIDASDSPNLGKYANQKVDKNVRKRFIEILCVEENITTMELLELIYLAYFMYYTGTRVNSSISFNFSERTYTLNDDFYMFEVLDKGRGKGIPWKKMLIGDALEKTIEYFEKRHKIPREQQQEMIPQKITNLFPSLVEMGYDKVRRIYKKCLLLAGLPYTDFMPCHIFRHTYAQECLDATDHNYEFVASTGGWKNSKILKDCYGEISEQAKERGLRKAMGLPIKDVTYILLW